jgi:hypothetical protein
MTRWSLLVALLSLAVQPAAAQSPIAKVQIYTDARPAGLDTAVMQRPTWGLIRARIIQKNGQVDTKTAVSWRTQDSTKVRLRLRLPQSVAIESPMSSKLGATKVIVDVAGRHDTLAVVVLNGLTRVELDSARYTLGLRGTRRVCAWAVTTTGTRILMSPTQDASYCAK